MVASFDRPEQDARSLPGLVAESFGIESYDDIIQQTTTSETKDLIDQHRQQRPSIDFVKVARTRRAHV